MTISLAKANYNNETDARSILHLLDLYSCDPMGNGKSLPESVNNRLIAEIQNIPGAFSIIAYITNGDKQIPVGLANCFMGFSTFKAKKLVNIHDLVVDPSYRGLGIGEKLLSEVDQHAKKLGCCKVTLEVRTDNPAERLYRRHGYTDGDNEMRFLVRELD